MLLATLGSLEAGDELRIMQGSAVAAALVGNGDDHKIKRLARDLTERAYPERW